LLAPVLGWDEATAAAEVEDYRRQVKLVKQAATGAATDEDAARMAEATTSLLPLP